MRWLTHKTRAVVNMLKLTKMKLREVETWKARESDF